VAKVTVATIIDIVVDIMNLSLILLLSLLLMVLMKWLLLVYLILPFILLEMLLVFVDDRYANVVARVKAASVTDLFADAMTLSLKLSLVLLHIVLLVKMMIVLSI
jgi:hypothetical protein